VTLLVVGRSRRFYLLLVLLVALFAAAVVEGVAWHDRASAEAVRHARCQRFTYEQHWRAARPSGEGARVVVLGDSWSSGFGLRHPQDSWPVRLPGRVYVDGFPGSGFSAHASGCAGVGYADRVGRDLKRAGSLVVVEGGLNDFDQPSAAIAAGFRQLMKQLHGRDVVVVGPASAPSRAAAVPRVDRLLASLCAKAEVPYYSTVDLRLSYLPDRLHPDQAGADAFGDAVAGFVADHAGSAA
jgi:acyl-CoA thioesterase-1